MRYLELMTAVLVACGPAEDEDQAPRPGDIDRAAPEVDETGSQVTLLSYDFTTADARFELPGRLDEISGLAFTADGRLLGHDDERGRVYEIDPGRGDVGKQFDLGSGNVQDDFEGIAAIGERLFLVSSTGFLYEFREGADEVDVPYRVTDTGLGSSCEVEGLDFDPDSEALLLACKRADGDGQSLRLYALPVGGGAATSIDVARSELAASGLDPDFQPSAVAVTLDGTWILLSAVTESIVEIDSSGRVLAGVALGRQNHPQPEGLAIGADGTLYIANERNGDDPHITVYRRQGDGA
ncbi:MAG: hypothetical protein HKN72_00130 [Gemmatimonadetes bacterium]|nr:hypothetical protein [Gemmatimonadota bacterium]